MNPTAELVERTTDPLHRAMLFNFWRDVHLEGAGEFDQLESERGERFWVLEKVLETA